MQQRWLVQMWAVSAAMMLGALTAIISSAGATPLWSQALLFAIVAVPTVITVASRRSRASAGQTGGSRSQSAFAKQGFEAPGEPLIKPGSEHRVRSVAPVKAQLTERDWDEMNRVCCSLESQQLDWLRTNDFHTPWLHARVSPLTQLEPLTTALAERPFPIGIAGALLVLADSLEEFVEFYSGNTSPDPVLRDTDWRFFDWSDLDILADEGAAWLALAARLQLLSRSVSGAYADLTSAAAGNPRSARHVGVLG